ncbi:MAG: sortase [Chloroflexi bacterium]|nr:MAG: sortase [Chloroflexota bacterium]
MQIYPPRSHPVRPWIITVVLGLLLGSCGAIYLFWRGAESPSPAVTPSLTPLVTGPAALNSDEPERVTLLIPSINVAAPVIETLFGGASWDVRNLGENAGHLEGTGWFDSPGNVVLAGHVELADGRPGIFARLDDLKAGDWVIVEQGTTQRRYRISAIKTVEADDLTVLYPTEQERLTLITCSDYDFLQNSYQSRVVVVADRVE